MSGAAADDQQGVLPWRPCLPDGVLHPGGMALTRRLVDCCGFAAGARVADLGCGEGLTVEYLQAERGLQALGVDQDLSLLEAGLRRNPALKLLRAEGGQLPLNDAALDGVLAECSLSVMGDAGRILGEISRVLAPGGTLGVCDLYWRHETAAGPPELLTRADLLALLTQSGLTPAVWEDHSPVLKEYTACHILQYGVPPVFGCRCSAANREPAADGERYERSGFGYFLLVAKKETVPAGPEQATKGE